MVRIVLIGNAAREHAIAEGFKRSTHEPRIFCVGELVNPAIQKICEATGGEFFRGNTKDPKFVADFAEKVDPDFVFVGPEEPNFSGIPDELERRGIACVGAKRAVAEIEMSKASMRDIQWKYEMPGRLWYKKFRNLDEAAPYLKEYADSIALKPARQAGGRGVKVIEDFQVYLQDEKRELKSKHAQTIIDEHMRPYEEMEYKLLIEERVWGPEYTLQCFTDGKCVKPMPAVQDNKHAFEGDLGPETGGMGSISGGMNLGRCGNGESILTEEEYQKSVEIIGQMIEGIQRETGERYHGVVAGQMMLTPIWGPTIIEMYSRFGDPEAVNVLPLLKGDLVEICEAIIDERLSGVNVEFEDLATVVKAVSPEGYPDRRDLARRHPVRVNEEAMKAAGVKCYWASIDTVNEKFVSGGSRLIECLGIAETIPAASEIAERGVKNVELLDGWRTFYRKDIGSPKCLRRRIELGKLAREIYKYREKRGILGKRMIWLPGKGLIEAG